MISVQKLCRDCFLRIFGREGNANIVDYAECDLCEGLSGEIEKFVDLIEERLKGYEFYTFSVGTKIDTEIIEKDEEMKKKVSRDFKDIKTWLNRRIGWELERRTGKRFVYSDYDINVIVDTRFDHVILQVAPVYIYGRYLKLVRGIPQTKWPCRICRGIGCRRCNYTGKQYPESVEEIIAKKVLEEFQGDGESFHGCGREDIDARMLGNGRPFVLEIKNPRKRRADLKELEKKINEYASGKVKVVGLRYSDKNEIRRLKEESFPKVYHAKIFADAEIQEKRLKEVLSSLEGRTIKQQTPLRVAHRRADKIREKKIYGCK
ncbi:tRNA pseudouridine(54/55) synthase Pus10, partial [bacterium]|nr:tRNA pseudouridine(54/55) synthase Pus10 [bacterium]